MHTKTLNNGINMPQVGLGVWKIADEQAPETINIAIEKGYRLIDTAMIYQNERGVGKALAQTAVPRDELFITTKVWNADQGYDKTLRAFDTSLEKLGLSYVDLYLVHWPTPMYDNYVETYQALEKLYADKRVKAIGVCNFDIEHLERLRKECHITPAVNQVECHPYLQQRELKAYCDEHGITLQAYSPLMNGRAILEDEVIGNIAKKHHKTAAQIVLRWHLERGHCIIPKTVTPSRMEENLAVFDFELDEEDLQHIAALDRGERVNSVPSEMDRR